MAISPREAAAANDKRHEEILADGETALNKILGARFTTGYSVTIQGTDFPIQDYPLALKLVKRFREAGWVVKHHDDQRDGSYWSFSEEKR